ncbi:hypothetical protein V6380_13950 [Acinetobacter variabilis]|uniref:hypothetical protein n=1 Tax=Acinetobacter variabilis TaxID=70346 RepID=UPI003B840E68
MNTSINLAAFNYQNEIKMANTLFDQDEDAGESLFKKASAKNKCQKKMTELLNGLRYDVLAVSLIEVALSHPEGKNLVETMFYAFINTLNSAHNIDLRNKASFDFFQNLKDNIETFHAPVIDIQDYKIAGFKDPNQLERLANLADIFNEIGLLNEASPVFASALMKLHPTHQQAFVRSFRNAMVEITARHHIHAESVDPELLAIATYAASCGQSIAFPYI